MYTHKRAVAMSGIDEVENAEDRKRKKYDD
jgi:hypothetical protein